MTIIHYQNRRKRLAKPAPEINVPRVVQHTPRG
jgi:hypothetical protein